jgi:uncharacterized protein YbaA (DUF1428 family)
MSDVDFFTGRSSRVWGPICGDTVANRVALHFPLFLLTQEEIVMTYIDGFVVAVPTANREAYKKHAASTAAVFKEYGALKVVECWGNDVPEGKVTSFTMAVQRKDDETVVFSWITWPSREKRDEAWKAVMADPRMQPGKNPMPFDGKRLIYGGFETILEV